MNMTKPIGNFITIEGYGAT